MPDRALAPFVAPAAPALAGRALPWEEAIAAYLDAACDSEHTRRAYRRHLRAVADGFAGGGIASVAALTGAHLAAYRAWIMQPGRGLSPASQAQALAALRSFLKWLAPLGGHHLPAEAIATALRTPRTTVIKPYVTLAEPEVAALLAAADTERDRALLGVLVGAGLRAAEAAGLDLGDVREDGEGGTALHVRQGKGRKDRVVPIRADVAALIRAYLRATGRRLGDDGPLFRAHDRGASRRRARLSTRSVGAVVARCCTRAGIDAKAISPHSLRHTMAIRALRAGANVVAVSKLLGHASVTTTQKYVDHLALDELRAAVPPLPAAGERR
jgi:site-specific recombinase XerD